MVASTRFPLLNIFCVASQQVRLRQVKVIYPLVLVWSSPKALLGLPNKPSVSAERRRESSVSHFWHFQRFRATQPRAAWGPRESQSVAPSDQSCGQEDLIAMVTMASMENERRCGNHSRPLIDGNRQPTVSQPRYSVHVPTILVRILSKRMRR